MSESTTSASAGEGRTIDWDAYASNYDLLAAHNPEYRDNIEFLRQRLPSFKLPDRPVICDIGAGTGNFLCALAQDVRTGSFIHVDANAEMNRIAADKYARAGIADMRLLGDSAHEVELDDCSIDLVICINALYAMPPQGTVLERVYRWLKPGGVFFVIDFGRQTKMLDWSRYILGSVISDSGWLAGMRLLGKSFGNFMHNYKGSKGQGDGTYWLHTTEEFKATLEETGFTVEEATMCYRNYCDLAVCRKPVG